MNGSAAIESPPLRRALVSSLPFLFLFLGMIFLLLAHRTVLPDRAISEALSNLPTPFYYLWSIVCRSGNVEVELPVLLFAGVIIWRRRKEDRPLLLFFFAALFVGTLFEHLLKMNLPRYAPTREFQHDPLNGWEIFFPAHFHVVSSFPSGHTFRVLLILLFVDRYYPRFRFAVLAWALLIMAGVVALGWHWSSDVIGSVLLVLILRPWIDFIATHQQKN